MHLGTVTELEVPARFGILIGDGVAVRALLARCSGECARGDAQSDLAFQLHSNNCGMADRREIGQGIGVLDGILKGCLSFEDQPAAEVVEQVVSLDPPVN